MKNHAAFSKIISVLLTTIKNVKQQSKTLPNKINRLIDYLAQHPLLDKIERIYRGLNKNTRQRLSTLQKSPAYKKAKLYAQLVRLDKPIGILLLLWPTLIALWIAAKGWPDPLVLFVFVAGRALNNAHLPREKSPKKKPCWCSPRLV